MDSVKSLGVELNTPDHEPDLGIGGIRTDIHIAIDKIADVTQPAVDRLVINAHSQVDKVSDAFAEAAENLAEKGQQLADVYSGIYASGKEQVRKNPLTSMLLALAAGFMLSTLFDRRK